MYEWQFLVKRWDLGEVTVKANTEEEARAMALDYGRRIILENNVSWGTRHVKENLIDTTYNYFEGE